MGSSTAVKVALLATCLLIQHAMAQRGGGSMIGSGSGSSDDSEGTRTGRGRTSRGSSSGANADNNNMAMTLGGKPSCHCPVLGAFTCMLCHNVKHCHDSGY